MANINRSFLLVIAGATKKELARQIKYLKVANEILRTRIPGREYVTPNERRWLVKFAMGLPAKAVNIQGESYRRKQEAQSGALRSNDGKETKAAHEAATLECSPNLDPDVVRNPSP